MKYFLITAFLVSFNALSQPKEVEMDYLGEYQDVVEIEKEELYNETLKWIGKTYNSAKTVIESQIESEFIKVRGISLAEYGIPQFDYSLEFDFKPNKYRISFTIGTMTVQTTSFEYSEYFKKDGTLRPANTNKKKRVDEKVQDLINSHYEFITEESDDDW